MIKIINSPIGHNEEELLEYLWLFFNEKNENEESVHIGKVTEELIEHNFNVMKIIETLHGRGDIRSEEGKVKLTKSGELRGKSVVRRHRLAERLLTDVLDVSSEILDTAACAFEHVLTEDVENKVCTLLGHPHFCPHNRPIPKGSCCESGILEISSAIVALNQVKSNHEATVAYISTKKYARLQKLMGFGVLPGTILEILRKSPGTVIKLDETIIALESDVISDIYVRKVKKIRN